MPEKIPTKKQSARVDELDGLRGLLALWVALAHICAWSGFWESRLPHRMGGIWSPFVDASSAVDTFIILSGFAISFLLHKRSQGYMAFMRGRFFRIYPVYLFCLLIGIVATFLTPFILETASWRNTVYFGWIADLTNSSNSALASHTIWHFTLLNGLIPNKILTNATGTLLAPAWSITLEWQYYLIAPILARLVRSGAGLALITILQWLVMSLVAIVGVKYGLKWNNPQLAFLPAYLPLFLVGIGSYHFYARYRDEEGNSPVPAIAAAVLLGVALFLQWHPIAMVAWSFGFGCILVRGVDPFARLMGIVRSTLLHPALQWLGHISFPLYLIHWPVIVGILSLALHFHPQLNSFQALALLLVVGVPVVMVAAV